MNNGAKLSSLQAFHTLIYRRPVHPTCFNIDDRRRIAHGEYAFESWVFRGGHALLFEYQELCVSEIVTERHDALSDRALIAALPCAGEKDFEETVAERIQYVTSVQTETLPDHLYLSSYREMLEHARAENCMVVEWTEPGEALPSMSVVDVQRYQDSIDVQGYHFRGDCALILRTQTVFEGLEEAVEGAAKEVVQAAI